MAETPTPITDTETLASFCATAANSAFVTIDTEFIREHTYYPKLCLVQVACEKEAVIIDPLAKGIDLAPLFSLLKNERVLKVFHAARQDLEIFYYLMGELPHPIFDTQVAAMVLGFGESISYDGLVQHLVGQQIDKSSRFTNWAQRPLTDKQLHYALSDVVHLRGVYEKLDESLKKRNRESWIDEEMAILLDHATYQNPPKEAWRRLKVRSTSARFLAVVQAVAAWREEMAQRMNLPRGRVVKDETLTDIAASHPETIEMLHTIRGMNKGLPEKHQLALLELIKEARNLPKSDLPVVQKSAPLPSHAEAAIELLRVLLKRQCDEHHVAQKLLASRGDMEQIALGNLANTPVAHGWRWEVFGQQAAKLMEGKMALSYNQKQQKVIFLEAS